MYVTKFTKTNIKSCYAKHSLKLITLKLTNNVMNYGRHSEDSKTIYPFNLTVPRQHINLGKLK